MTVTRSRTRGRTRGQTRMVVLVQALAVALMFGNTSLSREGFAKRETGGPCAVSPDDTAPTLGSCPAVRSDQHAHGRRIALDGAEV